MPDTAYPKILVPVDYSGCAWEVVSHASRVAAAFDAEVVLLYVVSLPAGVHLDDPSAGRTVGEAVDGEAATELAALQQAFGPNRTVRVEIRHGDVVPAICRAIKEHEAKLVVMGTHARTGLRRMVLGSVAEQVVRQSPVPVMVVRAPFGTLDEHSAAWVQAQAESEG